MVSPAAMCGNSFGLSSQNWATPRNFQLYLLCKTVSSHVTSSISPNHSYFAAQEEDMSTYPILSNSKPKKHTSDLNVKQKFFGSCKLHLKSVVSCQVS